MTDNKGDLISREALKKAITEATYNFEQIPIRADKVQEIIDNAPTVEPEPYNMDALNAFEVLKAYCKNRDCNKDCIFFREVMMGNKKDTFCALCEIVMSDDKEKDNEQK